MTNRYDGRWVDSQVTRCTEVWNSCAANPELLDPRYSRRDHESREIAYDAEMRAVEWEARHAPSSPAARAETQKRLIASFAQFAANALDLEPESTALLTGDFLPAGIEFARHAREFDASLSQADTIQACRNAWTACGLQPLLGVTSGITPSIVGYSLLYPYTDNYLDNEALSLKAKLAFSERFRERLRGATSKPLNPHEAQVWALVALIEGQYPRGQFPAVFDSLLAIHQAQEDSIAQQRNGSLNDAELLRLSFAKGGTSVLADAALARGWMTEEEGEASFEWGALLQLGDDLQDVRDDLKRGSLTLFTGPAGQGAPLDQIVLRLLGFCDQVAARMRRLSNGPDRLKDLLEMSWRSLIIAAVADAHEYFTPAFLMRAEHCSPFRFEFLRARRKRLDNRKGLYTVLFDLFVETSDAGVSEFPRRREHAKPCVETVV
jgi:hypothetical protein